MKKTAIYITIGALFLSLTLSHVAIASEVSGTISTGGNTQNPTPSPTPTPNPSGGNDQGHSSNGNGTIGGVVVGGNDSGSNNGNNNGGNNANSGVGAGAVGPLYYGSPTIPNDSATVSTGSEASTTPGISDEEMARFAALDFGPRYGVGSSATPGAPFAGGGEYSNLSVGGDETLAPDMSGEESPFALVPRVGEGPVSEDNLLAASALTDASGLSMPQLMLIALIALILIASMGYAISRANENQRAA